MKNGSLISGEVALPGGRWEEGDENDADTALREANEEIGLDPSIVEVVTTLEPFYTKVIIIIMGLNKFLGRTRRCNLHISCCLSNCTRASLPGVLGLDKDSLS